MINMINFLIIVAMAVFSIVQGLRALWRLLTGRGRRRAGAGASVNVGDWWSSDGSHHSHGSGDGHGGFDGGGGDGGGGDGGGGH